MIHPSQRDFRLWALGFGPAKSLEPRAKSLFLCIGLLCLCGSGLAGCGRKGPPLPPIVLLPNPVGEFTAKRAGDNIVLRFKVPEANTDLTTPVDLDRVEVYAHTGPLPAPTDFVRHGTLIATIKVKPPPVAEEAAAKPPVETVAATDKPAATDQVEPGWAASVSEPVTPALLEPGAQPFPPPRNAVPVVEAVETPETINEPVPIRRYYTAVGVSRSKNRRGPFGGPLIVPMVSPPSSPEGLKASYTESAITLAWDAMPGDPPPVAPAAEPPALETPGTVNTPETIETDGTVNLSDEVPTPSEIVPPAAGAPVVPAVAAAPLPPAPRLGYNVYPADAETNTTSAAPSPPTATTATATTVGPPVLPLNTVMLTTPSFTDALVEFGAQRCYAVRRVEMVSGIAIESAAAPAVCVTPRDTFPPAAPKELVAVSDDKGVNLIWAANTERDLAGYIVLRGEAPGEKMAPLTSEPIKDASFRDSTVQPGHAYVYAVVAVDNATPSNRSEESNRQTEAIR